MLSNFLNTYNNSVGSDCSDGTSEEWSQPLGGDEWDTRQVIHTDHSYGITNPLSKTSKISKTSNTSTTKIAAIDRYLQDVDNTTNTINHTFDQYLDPLEPLMACLDTNLFGDDVSAAPMAAYDDYYSDDFANAPTPFMAPIGDLNDIDANDLVDFTTADAITTHTDVFDFNGMFDSQEVVVDNNNNDTKPVTTIGRQIAIKSEVINDDYAAVRDLARAGRKRHVSYESFADEDMADASTDDENESVSATMTSASEPKAKVGRKPAKGGSKCMSRNAIAARENREKKKRESEDMRRRLNDAINSAKTFKADCEQLRRENQELNSKVRYLQSVLANDTSIAAVIKHISNATELDLIGTHFVAKPAVQSAKSAALVDDKSQRKSTRIAAKVVESVGVCVHVNNNLMSLEFCHKCAESSKKHMNHKKGK